MTKKEKYLKIAENSLAKMDNSYKYFPEEDTPMFVKGKGVRLYDPDGNEYFDMVSGYSALNQGHTHPKIVASLMNQANRLTHTSATLSDAKIELAAKLSKMSPIPDTLVHFDIGGARAVEGAKILVRAYTGKSKVISFTNSFHGRSTGSLSMYNADTFQHLFNVPRDYYQANYPYCYRCPMGKEKGSCSFECMDSIKKTFENNNDIGGIIVEPALGARGYILPPEGFYKKLRRLCDEHGILLISDEIQMGLGRLGSMFACEIYDTVPDIILLSKSLAGGMWPLSAILGRKEIMEIVRPGTLGSTFAGAPLACGVAITSLEVIEDENLCERSEILGSYFKNELEDRFSQNSMVANIDGMGLAIGVEFNLPNGDPATEETKKIQHIALKEGLLLQRGGPFKNIINMIPALNITREEINEFIDRFEQVVLKVENEYLQIIEDNQINDIKIERVDNL
ncbi:MAG: aspartate aminotransferase family protein [Myxococcota bacterium]